MSFLSKCCKYCLPCWTVGEPVHPVEAEVLLAQLPQAQRVQEAAKVVVGDSKEGQQLKKEPSLPIFIQTSPRELIKMERLLKTEVKSEEVNPTEQYVLNLKYLGIKHKEYIDVLVKAHLNSHVKRRDLIERTKIFLKIEERIMKYKGLGFKNTQKERYLDLLRSKLENIYFPSEGQDAKELIKKLPDLEKKLFLDLFIGDLLDIDLDQSQIKSILTKLEFLFQNNHYQFLNNIKVRIIKAFSYLNPYAIQHKKTIDETLFNEILKWAIEPKDINKSFELDSWQAKASLFRNMLIFQKDSFELDGERASPAVKSTPRGVLSDYRALSVTSSILAAAGESKESAVLEALKETE
jgi:hypothetical protein